MGESGQTPGSVASLLLQPGSLTREWRASRQARRGRPLRLYLLAALLFLAVLLAVSAMGLAVAQAMDLALAAAGAVVFLPALALLVAILALDAGRTYVEHLVFVLHLGALFFLIGAIQLGMYPVVDWVTVLPYTVSMAVLLAAALVGTGLTVYAFVYMVLAFRRVYDQRWWRAVFSALALSAGGLIAVVGFASLVPAAVRLALPG